MRTPPPPARALFSTRACRLRRAEGVGPPQPPSAREGGCGEHEHSSGKQAAPDSVLRKHWGIHKLLMLGGQQAGSKG